MTLFIETEGQNTPELYWIFKVCNPTIFQPFAYVYTSSFQFLYQTDVYLSVKFNYEGWKYINIFESVQSGENKVVK